MVRFLVAGNAIIKEDGGDLLKLVPALRRRFKNHEFTEYDPNEGMSGEVWIIDTIKGINSVLLLSERDIDKVEVPPNVSMHDFDIATQLKLYINLGIVTKVHIIAIPYGKVNKLKKEIIDLIKRMG
jgi:hypothetical protein